MNYSKVNNTTNNTVGDLQTRYRLGGILPKDGMTMFRHVHLNVESETINCNLFSMGFIAPMPPAKE